MELIFKLPINTLFRLRNLNLRNLRLQYVKFTLELSNLSEFKLLMLVFSDERVFSLKDTSSLDS